MASLRSAKPHLIQTSMQVLAFEAMQADSRVVIDVAALDAVVDAYSRCGRMPEAEACLHEATQCNQQRGVRPLTSKAAL